MARRKKPAPMIVDTRSWQERWLALGELLRTNNERAFDEMVASGRLRLAMEPKSPTNSNVGDLEGLAN